MPQQYNLCNRAVHVINLVLFEETPNMRQSDTTLVHQNKYILANKLLQIGEAYKHEMYTPIGAFSGAILDDSTGKTLEYRDLIKMDKYDGVWTGSFTKKLNQLAQGLCRHKGTKTINFICVTDMPNGQQATYGRIVVYYRPQKADPNKIKLTVGGNRVDYTYNASTLTADLTTSNILMNSTMSTPNTKFMMSDINNFYLNTPLEWYEYMRMKYDILPQEIIDKYELDKLVTRDGHIYIKIQK
eukprot:15333128-Ditylum_brightwellii.AAC.1